MAVKCEPQHELQDFKRNTVSASVAGQQLNLNPLVVNKETAIKKLVKRIFGNKCLKFCLLFLASDMDPSGSERNLKLARVKRCECSSSNSTLHYSR